MEGLRRLGREQFDVVIIDHMMPAMDGIAFAREIHALDLTNRPRLVLSASSGEISTHAGAKRLGIDPAMPKPVRLSSFEATMRFLGGEAGRAPGAERPAVEASDGQGAILLAEDNASNQLVVKTHLERRGYRVDIAPDGAKAIQCCERRRYDLILMDLRMPGIDGLEAARRIRQSERGRATPIIALTASMLVEDQAACAEAGMDDFIGKPIDAEELIRKVARWSAAGPAEAPDRPAPARRQLAS